MTSSQSPQPLTEGDLDTMRSSIDHAIYRSQYGMHGLSIEAERRLLNELFRLRAENTAQAAGVLGEIVAERAAQFAKFGEQNHPDGTGPYVKNPDRMSNMEDQAAVARFGCQEAAEAGRLNWMLILREEVYEAFAEKDHAALRAELIQVAAVAATWVDALDRRALGLDQDGSSNES